MEADLSSTLFHAEKGCPYVFLLINTPCSQSELILIECSLNFTCSCLLQSKVSLRNRTAEDDGRTLVCDKRDKAISYVFCCDLHLTSMFSGLLQKDLFKGRWILAKSYFEQNYCEACHTSFAVFFPLLSCCVSSLLTRGDGWTSGYVLSKIDVSTVPNFW